MAARTGPGTILLLAFACGGPVWGAEPEGPSPADPVPAPEPVDAPSAPGTEAGEQGPGITGQPLGGTLDELVPPYSEAWLWRRSSPPGGLAVVAAAAHPVDAGRVAAVTSDGTVWVSRDGGRTWAEVLAAGRSRDGLSIDESVLLGVDVRIDELLDVGSTDDLDEEAVADLFSEAIDAVTAETRADLEVDPEFTADQLPSSPGGASVTWLPGRLYAAVGGATYLSRDAGRGWGQVLDVMAHDVLELPSGASVALTEDGARISLDGRAFYDFVDGTEGRGLTGGVMVGDVLVAASADGLWASRDGENWRPWGSLRGEVRGLAAHPERPDVVWVITPAGLRRSGDGGQTFDAVVLRDAQLVDVSVPLPDRVVVTRPGSVLESRDDARTWSVATQGLEGVADARLAVGPDSRLLLATRDGLWTLRRVTEGPGARGQAWADLPDLLSASLDRQGLVLDFDPFRRRWSSAMMPRFQIDATTGSDSDLTWSGLGTRSAAGGSWRVMGRLVWTPRGSRSVDQSSYGVNIDTGVLVVDNQPILMVGDDDYVAAARLGQAVLGYRASLADTVTELYRARAELVAERARLRGERLQRQVLHELSIAEVEARLDALTDGAVLRWESARTLESQEL